MSNLNKKEKVGLWVSLAFAILALFGVQIPATVGPVIDLAQQIIVEELEVQEEPVVTLGEIESLEP